MSRAIRKTKGIFSVSTLLTLLVSCQKPVSAMSGVGQVLEVLINEYRSEVLVHTKMPKGASEVGETGEIELTFSNGERVRVPCSVVEVVVLSEGAGSSKESDGVGPCSPTPTDDVSSIPGPIYRGIYSPISPKLRQSHQFRALVPNRGVPIEFKIWVSGQMILVGKVQLKMQRASNAA